MNSENVERKCIKLRLQPRSDLSHLIDQKAQICLQGSISWPQDENQRKIKKSTLKNNSSTHRIKGNKETIKWIFQKKNNTNPQKNLSPLKVEREALASL